MGLQTIVKNQITSTYCLKTALCLLLICVSFVVVVCEVYGRMRLGSQFDNSVVASRQGRKHGDINSIGCLRNYFHDVLLVIVYHYPLYDTLPSIMPHYKAAFPNIVVCGPSGDKRFRILVVDMGPKGYYCYECLGLAMRRHPGYTGYLFINDDMVVNWWNFVRLDKDKVWPGANISRKRAHEVGRRPIRRDWIWWITTDGARKCEKTFGEIIELAKRFPTDGNLQKLLETHIRNGRNKTMCFKMWSDFAYVPGRLRGNFQFLCNMFFKNKVFLEIAVPTILSLLDDIHSWEKVFGTYLPNVVGFKDFSKPKNVWPYFTKDVLFLHPVKFFGGKGKKNRRIFETHVRDYARKFTSC